MLCLLLLLLLLLRPPPPGLLALPARHQRIFLLLGVLAVGREALAQGGVVYFITTWDVGRGVAQALGGEGEEGFDVKVWREEGVCGLLQGGEEGWEGGGGGMGGGGEVSVESCGEVGCCLGWGGGEG